jgi:prophage antirepressor-like protein
MIAKRCRINNHLVLVLFDSENKPWFKLYDVFMALGYRFYRRQVQLFHGTNYLKPLKDFPDPNVKDVKRLDSKTYFINEHGLCSLLVRSSTPGAKELTMKLLSERMYLAYTSMEDLSSS